jgi:hypothetical protein
MTRNNQATTTHSHANTSPGAKQTYTIVQTIAPGIVQTIVQPQSHLISARFFTERSTSEEADSSNKQREDQESESVIYAVNHNAGPDALLFEIKQN